MYASRISMYIDILYSHTSSGFSILNVKNVY